jgi:hypothetical protein
VKRGYVHTNKRQFVDQLINIDTVEVVHERMNNELAMAEGTAPATQPEYGDEDGIESSENVAETLGQRYHIAEDQANKIYLPAFLKDTHNATDPAFKVSTISSVALQGHADTFDHMTI